MNVPSRKQIPEIIPQHVLSCNNSQPFYSATYPQSDYETLVELYYKKHTPVLLYEMFALLNIIQRTQTFPESRFLP